MDDNYIRERISHLRIQKNISEYKMSLDLGHSKSYKDIIPQEFFDTENEEPVKLRKLYTAAEHLSPEDIDVLLLLAERLSHR